MLQMLLSKISVIQNIQIIQLYVAQYNTFNMSITSFLCLFLLTGIAITSPLTQNQVDEFVRGGNLVPPTAIIKDFKYDNGKSIISYEDQFTVYKFVVAQGLDGNPFILFRHQLTQINLSNNGIENPTQQINFIPGHPVFQFQPMSVIQIPPPFTNNFDQQTLSGIDIPFQNFRGRHGQRHGQRHGTKGRGFKKGMGARERGCRINEQEVKMLLKENLVIFRNAQVQKIQKIGFQRGSGIILSITLKNQGKEFNVQAGYMPRWNKLNVLKVAENNKSIEDSPIETEDSNPIIEQGQVQSKQNNLGMESIIQSFIEKLLIRKSFDLGTKQQPPILLGNQGQHQNPTILQFEAPILLGKQGQVENPTAFNQPPFLLGKQGEPESQLKIEKPISVGNEGEPQNNYRFVQRKQPIEKVEENGKQQVASQQISDIVTEVISKLKLKKK